MDLEQLRLSYNELSMAHGENKGALIHVWQILLWLLCQHQTLRQELSDVWDERVRLKQELIGTARASAAHRKRHSAAERKIGLLMALAIDLQVKLSTLHALQVRARRRLIEEFIRKVIELLGGWKPTA